MTTVTKPYSDFVNAVDVADAIKVNAQINTLYNAINGGLDGANVPTLGDVTTLTTTIKNTVIAAMNEIAANYPIQFMNRQALINGNFDRWERLPAGQLSFTTPANNSITADRWFVTYDGTIGTFTVSRQSFVQGQTAVPNNPKYFYRWDQTAAGSVSNYRIFGQKIEGVQTFSGQKCTVSFWAKADVSRSITITARQFFGTGGTPSSFVDTTSASINLTTSWQKFTVTLTLPSISGKTYGTNGDDDLQINFNLPVNTIMTMDFSEAQINAGDVALPFQPKSYQEEETLCQRYNQRIGGSAYTLIGVGEAISTTRAYVFIPLLKKMRIIPTLVSSVPAAFRLLANNTIYSATTIFIDTNQSTPDRICLVVDVASGLTVGQTVLFSANNDSTAFINFDAEL